MRQQEAAVKSLEQRVSTLEEEVSQLRREVRATRRVDMVDFGELRAYMYMDDLAYRQLDAKYKGHIPSPNSRDFSEPYRSERERYNNDAEPLLSLLFSHYWMEGLPFSYIDIGCQYGISALAAAQIIASARKTNHVYAFDPGAAGKLAPSNIILNSMGDFVTFEPMAVSSGTFPGLVFTELGHTENNRLVNRTPGSESWSYVAMCTSIDEYANSQDEGGGSQHNSEDRHARWGG